MAVCASKQAEEPADATQEEAFDNCLLQEPCTAGAESGAHGLLARARHCSRQHEAGYVEACQRPDTNDHGVEQHERLARIIAERLLIASNGNARGHIVAGDLFGDDGLRSAESRSQLRRRHALGQPCKWLAEHRFFAAHCRAVGRRKRKRCPYLHLIVYWEGEATRHDADDGVGPAADSECFAQNLRIGKKEFAPCIFAKKNHAIAARVAFFVAKYAA